MIKIMLADDQQLVREALAALLGLEHDIEVVAQVGGGDEVIPAINRYHPDVVLLDIEMPGSELSSGIDVAAAIRDRRAGTFAHCDDLRQTGVPAACSRRWGERVYGEGYKCIPAGGGHSACSCGYACGGSGAGGRVFGVWGVSTDRA